MSILLRVEADRAYPNILLHHVIEHRGPTCNPGLLSQLVYGVVESRQELDRFIEPCIHSGLDKTSPEVRALLRLGLYQIKYLDKIPRQVAVNECVELAKRAVNEGAARLVNAVLRRLTRESNFEEVCSPEKNFPEWMVTRWRERSGNEETSSLCAALNLRAPTSLRTNTLKISPEDLMQRLRTEGIDTRSGAYLREIFLIDRFPKGLRLRDLKSFQEGLFQVQDEASALIAHVVAPLPGETIVDLCSGPGGKTTHLAEIMKNDGKVIAVELYEQRLQLVQECCKRFGATCVDFVQGDGAAISLPQQVDRVLVDAPCSGLGVVGRKSDLRWNKSIQDIYQLAALQEALLIHAATLVKEGGILVYSTCTIEPEENEEIVRSFLKNQPEWRLGLMPKTVPEELVTPEGFLVPLPHRHGLSGGFAARFRKLIKVLK